MRGSHMGVSFVYNLGNKGTRIRENKEIQHQRLYVLIIFLCVNLCLSWVFLLFIIFILPRIH